MTNMNAKLPLISTLENYLRLTSSREQTISANMANVDTPGYHTHDINFQGEMRKAMNLETSGGTADTVGDGSGAQMNPAVLEVSGLMERPDGNNVSLDREGLLMSETQLQYAMGIQLVKHHFHSLMSAISGGGS